MSLVRLAIAAAVVTFVVLICIVLFNACQAEDAEDGEVGMAPVVALHAVG